MKPTPYDTEITKLEEELTRVGTELKEAKNKRAAFVCPFKVGQILIGKKGRRVRLEAILPGYDDGYKLIGRFILKNGADGKEEHELYSWDKWTKEDHHGM